MLRIHQTYLGRGDFPPDLTEFEIGHFFTFDADELADVQARFDPNFRIAALLQLGFLKLTGTKLEVVRVVPRDLLRHVSDQLGFKVAPQIASLKRLYAAERTKRRHLAWAMDRLGWSSPTNDTDRQLSSHLKEVAPGCSTVNEVLKLARLWMFQQKLLIRAERTMVERSRRIFLDCESGLYEEICKSVPEEQRDAWKAAVLSIRPGGQRTMLEWLQSAPKKKSPSTQKEQFEKVEFLKGLGVDKIELSWIPSERLKYFFRQLRRRKPSRLNRVAEPRRTLELICFLRYALDSNTDIAIDLSAKRTSELQGRARDKVKTKNAASLEQLRKAIREVGEVAGDDTLVDVDAMRQRLNAILGPLLDKVAETQAESVRTEMLAKHHQVRSDLQQLMTLDIRGVEGSRSLEGLNILRDVYDNKAKKLPPGKFPVMDRWNKLVNENDDDTEALHAAEAAVLIETHRALRHGVLFVTHSEDHRDRNTLLISDKAWEVSRKRYYAQLELPETAEEYLKPFQSLLEARLMQMSRDLDAGLFWLDKTKSLMSLSPIEAEDAPEGSAQYESMLAEEAGYTQLPELMLEIDSETRFSWALLGRAPQDDDELLSVYGAVLANGTDLPATSVSLMVPGLSAERVSSMMHEVEGADRMRKANDDVVEFVRRFPVTKLWGAGTWASSDMMSLDVTRNLYLARIDPRRQTPAIGMYTHIIDQWPIIYDQPCVIGKRQAGAAIEGALRQQTTKVTTLSVDTHGYTGFSMALAKLVHLDLCPRLRDRDEMRLIVPKGTKVPDNLKPVTEFLPMRKFFKNWDALVRVAASVADGTISAVLACDRFGSASRGDPIHDAGDELGLVLRTLFLADYYTNPVFRRELHRVLNRGESIHKLQRAIYSGRMPHNKGRTMDALVAISGSLTLLSNLVIAWATRQTQKALDRLVGQGVTVPKEVMAHIGPARWWNVNFRGIFSFVLDRFRSRLIQKPGSGARKRES